MNRSRPAAFGEGLEIPISSQQRNRVIDATHAIRASPRRALQRRVKC
jgi:hypothetical protein